MYILHKGPYETHACREIRHGRLTRDQALALVRRHERAPAEHSALFAEWLGVEPRALAFVMDQHRNRKYWREVAPGRWDFAGWSTLEGASDAEQVAPPTFTANSRLERDRNAQYVIVGKGYP